MSTKIRKWGNSLGVRIPKVIAEQAGVYAGAEVDIEVADGNLIIRPKRSQRYALDSLLEGVTDDNLHEAVETGRPRGRESW